MQDSRGTVTPWNHPFVPQRADPYILHEDGAFWMTASVPAYDRIVLRKAGTLAGLRAAPETAVWHAHESGPMSKHVWAPELHRIDGRWYLYFAAGERDDIWKIRPWILRCASDDPLAGPWTELGGMRAADPFSFRDFSLDMTTFVHRGQRYCVWAEKVAADPKISNLYIARMDGPDALATPQMLLSSPTYAWERHGFWVNEGPAFLPGGDRVFLTYSASDTSAAYCMGMLWADADADLMDFAAWHKSPRPVFATDAARGIYGPGHNSFFRDEAGDWCMAYHARPYEKVVGDPLNDPNRHCFVLKVRWADGMPVFSTDSQLFTED
ncbi:MAG: family 43 glycosylhydrolase [Clostridia bacterium]|nr:family 43 glycosylhydrolase [Clostridia bacterium]